MIIPSDKSRAKYVTNGSPRIPGDSPRRGEGDDGEEEGKGDTGGGRRRRGKRGGISEEGEGGRERWCKKVRDGG